MHLSGMFSCRISDFSHLLRCRELLAGAELQQQLLELHLDLQSSIGRALKTADFSGCCGSKKLQQRGQTKLHKTAGEFPSGEPASANLGHIEGMFTAQRRTATGYCARRHALHNAQDAKGELGHISDGSVLKELTSATDVTLAPSVWPRLVTALETAAAAEAPVLEAALDAAEVPARPCSTGPAESDTSTKADANLM